MNAGYFVRVARDADMLPAVPCTCTHDVYYYQDFLPVAAVLVDVLYERGVATDVAGA